MSIPCPQPFCDGSLRSAGKRAAGKHIVRYRYCDRCDYGERCEFLPEVLLRTSRVAKRAPKSPPKPELDRPSVENAGQLK